MPKNTTSTVMELTIDEFTQMLTEYAKHDQGPLRGEAQRLLDQMDNTHPAGMRHIVNEWTITCQSHHGMAPTRLASTIILKASIADRLIAARAALADTMPPLVETFNQLYRMMAKTQHPAMDQLTMFAEVLEQDYPGIRYFLDSKTQRIEDAGDLSKQLDLVYDLLLTHPNYQAEVIFRLATPGVLRVEEPEPRVVEASQDDIAVKIGDTEVTVQTQAHPVIAPVSAIDAYNLT